MLPVRCSDLPGPGLRVCRGRAWRLSGLVPAQAAGARTNSEGPLLVGLARQAVIVGGGPAGDGAAAGLRDAGFDGRIVLVAAESEVPYERPHLSKGYLLGTVPRKKLPLRPAQQYRELGVELMLGSRVADLGLERRAVELESGATVAWDRLCVATGSDARRLPGFGDALYLRELPQADHLRGLIDRGEPLDIVGAGFIGCEVAAVAVTKRCSVRVHEALEQPLLRVLGPELGGYIAAMHRARGVDLRTGVSSIPRVDNALLVAVGSVPRSQPGLRVDGGIVVDEWGRTSVPDVYAAGDGTKHFSPLFETHIRVEHFQTAQRQGFAVGRAIAGASQPYSEVPWFWSDQYDLNLQYAGAGLRWDSTITRGEFGKPPFTVFYMQAGIPIAVAGVNDHHTVARARRLMEVRKRLSAQQLADPTFDLRLAGR